MFILNNEKSVLSVSGEQKAFSLSQMDELKNIDAIYSSSYARCIGTAKYIAKENEKLINIIGHEEGLLDAHKYWKYL